MSYGMYHQVVVRHNHRFDKFKPLIVGAPTPIAHAITHLVITVNPAMVPS
jgi:hypothetical protein